MAAVGGLALVLVACGDDDADDAATEAPVEGEQAGADLDEFCAALEEVNTQDASPTVEQLENLKELRPDEIGDAIDTVADAIIASDGDIGAAFSDPTVEESMTAIDDFTVDSCGVEPSPEDEGGDEELVLEPAEGHAVVSVVGADFSFAGLSGPLAAGPTALEFTNEGESEHELVLFKLGEGVVLDELLASEEEPSEEEAQMIGATFGRPGDAPSYINADLEPGTYAMLCFIPGPEGKPHFELGMKATFEVE